MATGPSVLEQLVGAGPQILSAGQRERARRLAEQRRLERRRAELHRLDQLAAAAQIAKAPAVGGGGGFIHDVVHNPVADFLGLAVGQAAGRLLGTPGGIVSLYSAIGKEVMSPFRYAGSGFDEKYLTRAGHSAAIDLYKGMGSQMIGELQDPLANPGNIAVDWLPLIFGARGGVARLGKYAPKGYKTMRKTGKQYYPQADEGAYATRQIDPGALGPEEAKGRRVGPGAYAEHTTFAPVHTFEDVGPYTTAKLPGRLRWLPGRKVYEAPIEQLGKETTGAPRLDPNDLVLHPENKGRGVVAETPYLRLENQIDERTQLALVRMSREEALGQRGSKNWVYRLMMKGPEDLEYHSMEWPLSERQKQAARDAGEIPANIAPPIYTGEALPQALKAFYETARDFHGGVPLKETKAVRTWEQKFGPNAETGMGAPARPLGDKGPDGTTPAEPAASTADLVAGLGKQTKPKTVPTEPRTGTPAARPTAGAKPPSAKQMEKLEETQADIAAQVEGMTDWQKDIFNQLKPVIAANPTHTAGRAATRLGIPKEAVEHFQAPWKAAKQYTEAARKAGRIGEEEFKIRGVKKARAAEEVPGQAIAGLDALTRAIEESTAEGTVADAARAAGKQAKPKTGKAAEADKAAGKDTGRAKATAGKQPEFGSDEWLAMMMEDPVWERLTREDMEIYGANDVRELEDLNAGPYSSESHYKATQAKMASEDAEASAKAEVAASEEEAAATGEGENLQFEEDAAPIPEGEILGEEPIRLEDIEPPSFLDETIGPDTDLDQQFRLRFAEEKKPPKLKRSTAKPIQRAAKPEAKKVGQGMKGKKNPPKGDLQAAASKLAFLKRTGASKEEIAAAEKALAEQQGIRAKVEAAKAGEQVEAPATVAEKFSVDTYAMRTRQLKEIGVPQGKIRDIQAAMKEELAKPPKDAKARDAIVRRVFKEHLGEGMAPTIFKKWKAGLAAQGKRRTETAAAKAEAAPAEKAPVARQASPAGTKAEPTGITEEMKETVGKIAEEATVEVEKAKTELAAAKEKVPVVKWTRGKSAGGLTVHNASNGWQVVPEIKVSPKTHAQTVTGYSVRGTNGEVLSGYRTLKQAKEVAERQGRVTEKVAAEAPEKPPAPVEEEAPPVEAETATPADEAGYDDLTPEQQGEKWKEYWSEQEKLQSERVEEIMSGVPSRQEPPAEAAVEAPAEAAPKLKRSTAKVERKPVEEAPPEAPAEEAPPQAPPPEEPPTGKLESEPPDPAEPVNLDPDAKPGTITESLLAGLRAMLAPHPSTKRLLGKEKKIVNRREQEVPIEASYSRSPAFKDAQRLMYWMAEKATSDNPGKLVGAFKAPAEYWLNRKYTQAKVRAEATEEALNIVAKAVAIPDARNKAAYLATQTKKLTRQVQQSKKGTARFARAVDTLNTLTSLGVLYAKGPGYLLPNLSGALFVLGADVAFNPVSLAQSARLMWTLKKNHPAAYQQAKAAMQSGIATSLRAETGMTGRFGKGVRSLHENVSKGYGLVLDEPWRAAAIGNELRRRRIFNADDAADLFTNPERRGELFDVVERANENAIDFSRMSPFEKKWMRRIIFFYPWIKASTRYSGHFVAEHPLQSAQYSLAGAQSTETQKRLLGALPSYLQGVMRGPDWDIPGIGNLAHENVPGLGEVPRTFNLRAASVLGTSGELLAAGGANLLSGDPTSTEQLPRFLNPLAAGILSSAYRADPYTGEKFPAGMTIPEIFLQEQAQAWAIPNIVQRFREAGRIEDQTYTTIDKKLLPRTRSDVVTSAGLGFGPTPINPAEAHSRAQAEVSEAATKVRRVWMKNQQDKQEILDAAKRVGVDENGKLPVHVRESFNRQAQRDRNIALFEMNEGHPPDALERLVIDMNFLVRRKELTAKMAHDLYEQLKDQPDSLIQRVGSKMAERARGINYVSWFKKVVNYKLEQLGEAPLS
jgi:hypothetical protein